MSAIVAFWFLAALITVAALASVAVPLLRRSARAPLDQQQRLAVYRDRKREIKQERDAGRLTADEAEQSLRGLTVELSENLPDLANESTNESANESASVAAKVSVALSGNRQHRVLAILLALTIPIGALGLYNALGMPQIIGVDANLARGEPTVDQVDEAIVSLKQRTAKSPADLEGLSLLAQAYRVKGDAPGAVGVYEQAVKVLPAGKPESARLLADYAELLLLMRNGKFEGEPMALLERALTYNSDDQKTLGLYGAGLYRAGKATQALVALRKLQASLPAGEQQEAIASLVQRISGELTSAGSGSSSGAGAGAVTTPAVAVTPPGPAATAVATSSEVLFNGTVRVSDELMLKYDRKATLFVVAREAGGPPMPVAVLRLAGRGMPVNFELGDQHSMTGDRKLSTMASVTIEARLSSSGNAIRQPGDLIGSSAAIKPGQRDLQIVIDRLVP